MHTTTVFFEDPASKNICSSAGVVLPATVATRLGVVAVVDAVYPQLAANRIHSAGRVVAALAVALAAGGDDLSDINLLSPLKYHGLVDTVASVPTAYRRITELAADSDLDGLYTALGRIRQKVFSAMGWANPLHRASVYQPLFVDIDATIIPTHSKKQHTAPTWKRSFGYHPLLAMIDYGDDLAGEVLVPLLRPGNAGANTAADHRTVLDKALLALGGGIHADGLGLGKRLIVRCDGGGGSAEFINYCNDQGFGYVIGMRHIPLLVDIVTALPDELIFPLPGGGNDEFIADVTDYLRLAHHNGQAGITLENYPPDMRFIIRVSYPAQGAHPTEDEIFGRRIQLCVTNLHGYSAASIDRMYSKRGRAEQRICDIKDTGLGKLPFRDFQHNQIWAIIAALAHSLHIWTGLFLGPDHHNKDHYTTTGKHRWWLWQPKTLRARMLTIAAKVTHTARKTIIRFDGACPWAKLLTNLLTRLQKL